MVKTYFLAYFIFCFIIICLPTVTGIGNLTGGLLIFTILWAIGFFSLVRYQNTNNRKTSFVSRLFSGVHIATTWIFKTIFKGLKWLFSYEGLKSIGSLIFALLYAVFVLVSYLAAVIFAISAIIGLIAGIIDLFKLFKKD